MSGEPDVIELSSGFSSEPSAEDTSDVSSESDESWRDTLRECLDAIEATGQITSFQRCTQFTNPGLKIEGHPVIPLPLTEDNAQTIKGICRQAPFGKGEETLVDPSVRRTWELDPTQFGTVNPSWPLFLDNVLNQTAKDLGLGQVTVKPHKLLLYEPGSFFRKHKDSEKEVGMVGTLVICLPSEHQGADVHVSFGSEKRVLQTAPTSAFDLTALAWYSDVTHEVKELTSGYRLVLTYKLFQLGITQHSATAVFAQSQRLGSLLRSWVTKHSGVRELFYPLDHKYTKSSVSLSNMKGRDRAVCQLLTEVGSQAGLFLLFAHVTHSVNEEEFGDEPYTELNEVYSPDGGEVSLPCHIEQEDILGADLEMRDADSESEGDFTGNESMPSTLRYHDTVVLLVRKHNFSARFTALQNTPYVSSAVVKNMLEMVDKDLKTAPNDPITKGLALASMENALKIQVGWDAQTVRMIARWALTYQRDDLVAEAIKVANPNPNTLITVCKTISYHLQTKYAQKEKPIDWDRWLDILARGAKRGEIEVLFQSFHNSLVTQELKDSLNDWRQRTVERKIDSSLEWKVEDHAFIIRSLSERAKDTEWVMSKLLPSIAARGNPDILFEVLNTLERAKDTMFVGRATDMYKCVLKHSDSKLNLKPKYLRETNEDSIIYTRKFLRMLEGGYKVGASEETTEILAKSCTYLVITVNTWVGNATTVPFLQQVLVPLALRLKERGVCRVSSIQEFYETCLHEIHKKFIPTKPRSIPKDWKHKPRKCSREVPQLRGPCDDCIRLNAYMASKDQRTWSFPAGLERRKHVSRDLPDDLFTKETQNTRPQTLVVTKKGTEHDRIVGRHQRAVHDVRGMLAPLNSPYLRELLGEEKYYELVKLEEPPPRADGGAQGQSSSESSRRLTATSGNAAGLKRDLDDDTDQSEAKRIRL